MGMSSGTSIGRLGPHLQMLGMVSLLLVGLGMLLEAISGYVDIVYGASQGLPVTTGDGIWAALDTLLLIISILAIIASIGVRRGRYPKKPLIGTLLLGSISLIVQGGGMFAISTSSSFDWVAAAVLAIVAGVVLLIGLFISMGSSMAMRLTGAIFSLAFVILFAVRLGVESAPGGGYSLSSYLLAPLFSFYGADPGSGFTTIGIVGFTYLVFVAYTIVALGVFINAILQRSRFASITWVVALVGFLLYGIDMAWGNIAALANANWTYVSSEMAYTITPVITATIFAVAAFIVMATSIVGIVFYAGSLGGMLMAQPSVAQTEPTQAISGIFCPSCGTENPADNNYCKKCGVKLG
jgi:hypothetical protein